LSGRLYASVAKAEADALKANAGKANEDAVAALAAYRVTVSALPFYQTAVDPLIAKQLAGLSQSDIDKAAAVAAGPARAAAAAYHDDGAKAWPAFKPAPADGPDGAYQFAPGQTFAVYPQLANATLFALGGGKQTAKG
jgi:hypothetical protein